ncbi:MAG: DKNYY domain-containing protein [Patescibacteria group bacterium]
MNINKRSIFLFFIILAIVCGGIYYLVFTGQVDLSPVAHKLDDPHGICERAFPNLVNANEEHHECKVRTLQRDALYFADVARCFEVCDTGFSPTGSTCGVTCLDGIYIVDANDQTYSFKNLGLLDVMHESSFEIFPCDGCGIWARDKNNFYDTDGNIVDGIDPLSVKIYTGDGGSPYNTYILDDKSVLCWNDTFFRENGTRVIEGADPETFEVMNNRFSRDKNNVYESCKKLPENAKWYYMDYYGWEIL